MVEGAWRKMEGNVSRALISAPHGVKRRAEEEPREEQRLAKRFDLLNLGENCLHMNRSRPKKS